MTELIVVTQAQMPTLSIRPETQDLDALDRMIAEEEASRGGMFPGNIYSIKKSKIVEGYSANGTRLDERGFSLVLNVANMVYGWQMFDRAVGKNGRMVYGAIARPLASEMLPDRNTLGHLDEELWDEYNGKKMDPWTKFAAIPFRFDGETKVHTLFIQSWSQLQEVRNFLKDYIVGYKKNIGKFPVVNLVGVSTPHWDDPHVVIETMSFQICDWDMPIKEDFPDLVAEEAPPRVTQEGKPNANENTGDEQSRGETVKAEPVQQTATRSAEASTTDAPSTARRSAQTAPSGRRSAPAASGQGKEPGNGAGEMWGGKGGGRRQPKAEQPSDVTDDEIPF